MIFLTLWIFPAPTWAWYDETHLAIAKAAGYEKWYNAAGADITKIKAGDAEQKNHFSNNPPGTIISPEMVLEQASRYNDPNDTPGHLYGAIIASIREYRTTIRTGKYAEYHLAFCAHYVGDLSQPLHNTLHDSFNKKVHVATDGIIEDEVLNNLSLIEIYPIKIESETDLPREIARIANLSTNLGYQLEKENRMLTKEEAYRQISHSASLFKGILNWLKTEPKE
ncbi:hypothetical protein DSCO28_55860 [Desulfosarcina ovata subsp. sediminis]|uniref:Phospholipase C/D domain-containing protein n=1 Tax=Desulfosarcina ovata subsp. sediminis TaxID=885957 RepID=A0A5K7ZY50_9BACT|nr:hypothetical protein DSCO28_55860 [Desulfosarcina ovata subsp. sediminis]